MVYPYFGPDEDVNCNQEREEHGDEDRGINEKEPAPERDILSRMLLKT